jgi:hypothetical protein
MAAGGVTDGSTDALMGEKNQDIRSEMTTTTTANEPGKGNRLSQSVDASKQTSKNADKSSKQTKKKEDDHQKVTAYDHNPQPPVPFVNTEPKNPVFNVAFAKPENATNALAPQQQGMRHYSEMTLYGSVAPPA